LTIGTAAGYPVDMSTPNLSEWRTPQLSLRRPTVADLQHYVRFSADERVTATLGGVRDPEWVRQRLQWNIDHWEQHGFGWWTFFDARSGAFAGRGGLRWLEVEGRRQLEIGYGFLVEFWGRGLATELARECVRLTFEVLDLPEVISFTLPTNLASRRVMEKAGLRYDHDGTFVDLPHVFYRLTRAEWHSAG
jgi:ribosomal-protein-alanine N-acetyltransferase